MKKKYLFFVAFILVIILSLVGCTDSTQNKSNNGINNNVEVKNDEVKNEYPIATIEMSDGGIIKAELYPNIAPETVKNFIYLANSGFYNNLIFYSQILVYYIPNFSKLT